MTRIRIAETVMQKCGAFGLQDHDPQLARLLKRMVKLSAIASGNFNEHRRRYGAFILTVRDNTLVDINTEDDTVICSHCLGTTILRDGQDCTCIDDECMV